MSCWRCRKRVVSSRSIQIDNIQYNYDMEIERYSGFTTQEILAGTAVRSLRNILDKFPPEIVEKNRPQLETIYNDDASKNKKYAHRIMQWYLDNDNIALSGIFKAVNVLTKDYERLTTSSDNRLKSSNIYDYDSIDDWITDVRNAVRLQELKKYKIDKIHHPDKDPSDLAYEMRSNIGELIALFPDQIHKLGELGQYKLYQVSGPEALSVMSNLHDADWCTNSLYTAMAVINQGPVFLVLKGSKLFRGLFVELGEYLDRNQEYLWNIFESPLERRLLERYLPKEVLELPKIKRHFLPIDQYIEQLKTMDPRFASQFCIQIGKPIPDLEDTIVLDNFATQNYNETFNKELQPKTEISRGGHPD